VDGPLASFPRGAAAGDCLHRILERIDFQLPGDHPDTRRVVERELQRAGVASDLVNAVGEGLDRVRLMLIAEIDEAAAEVDF
jgi:exodeoxyribonuclease V beta subunit